MHSTQQEGAAAAQREQMEPPRLPPLTATAFQYLKRAGEGLFTWIWRNGTRGNGLKLKEDRLRLDVRMKFFTVRVVMH